MSDDSSPVRANIVPLAIVTAIAVGVLTIISFTAKKADDPVEQVSGIVEAITYGPKKSDRTVPERTAIIRLADGTLVQARVAESVKVGSGQKARMLVYQQVFSATRTYELVAAETVK